MLGAFAFPLIAACALPGLGATCESLSALKLPDTRITVAESVAGERFDKRFLHTVCGLAACYRELKFEISGCWKWRVCWCD